MSTAMKNIIPSNDKALMLEEQQKIDEVRLAVSPLPEMLCGYCSDASIARYLRAQNWNVKKAAKMLRESLKWRSEFKPDEIFWEDIVSVADSGIMYRSTSVDKKGRPVLVMRPCHQTSDFSETDLRSLVYCIENAVLNLPADQEEMIWLVDFRNFRRSNLSVRMVRETSNILKNYYPDRLGTAIMYNPPWIFEQFYKVVKPFLDSRLQDKVKFVYAGDTKSMKIMEDLFDIDQLETAFGGKAAEDFDSKSYGRRMREDDAKRRSLFKKGPDASALSNCNGLTDVDPSKDDTNHTVEDSGKSMNCSEESL